VLPPQPPPWIDYATRLAPSDWDKEYADSTSSVAPVAAATDMTPTATGT
jgi:hypothetical protein